MHTSFAACILGLALAPLAGEQPVWVQRVQELIRELGDPSFARREAATKAILAEGAKVVPLLERARPGADLETTRRLELIRRHFVGYRDDITKVLSESAAADERPPPPEPHVVSLLAAYQPQAGDFLLEIIGDPTHPLRRAAIHLFCATWETGTAAQLGRYWEITCRPRAIHLAQYPQRSDVHIETRWWPHHGRFGQPQGLRWQTEIIHFLDGRPHRTPFIYAHPDQGATQAWIDAADLLPGKHSVRFEVEFTVTHDGETRRNVVRSPEFTFRVASGGNLMVAADAELNRQVRQSLRIVEHINPLDEREFNLRRRLDNPWRPQVTWIEAGKQRGLCVPQWSLTRPLDVDLYFAAELLDLQTGKRYPTGNLVVKRGQTGQGHFVPRDVHAFAAGRAGFVEVEVHLRPSRWAALTDREISAYFAAPIASKVLRAKIVSE